MHRKLKRWFKSSRKKVSPAAGHYLQGVINYCIQDVFHNAKSNMHRRRSKRIQPIDLAYALKSEEDIEWFEFCKNVTIPGLYGQSFESSSIPKQVLSKQYEDSLKTKAKKKKKTTKSQQNTIDKYMLPRFMPLQK